MILLMGISGSGKGTQGKMLTDRHGLHLISMGEVVRMYITGEQRQHMLAGELLDDRKIIEILDKVLKTIPDDEECILDGFPRTIPQAEWLLDQVRAGRFKLSHVIHLIASKEMVKQRLLQRGRIDDHEEVINERFNEYEKATEPLFQWFEKNGVGVENVNAERSIDEVHEDLVKLLSKG